MKVCIALLAVCSVAALDAKYALDHLPDNGPAGRLAAKIDISRLGVAGHSMGGVAGAQFCVEDRRAAKRRSTSTAFRNTAR